MKRGASEQRSLVRVGKKKSAPHNFTDTIACAPELVPIPPNVRRPVHMELCGLVRDGIKGLHRAVESFDPKSEASAINLPSLTARVIRLDCVVSLVKHIFRKRLLFDPSTKLVQRELTHVSQRAELILAPEEAGMLIMPGADLALIFEHKSQCVLLLDKAIDATDPMFESDRMSAVLFNSVEAALDKARVPYGAMLDALGYADALETFEEFAAEARTRVCARYATV